MKQLLLALTIGLTAMGCRDKEEPQADCGCNSPTLVKEYNNQKELEGNIFYDSSRDKFVILGSYASNFTSDFYICNVNILPKKVLQLKGTDNRLKVNFKGDLKSVCEEITFFPEASFYNIVITKIELQ